MYRSPPWVFLAEAPAGPAPASQPVLGSLLQSIGEDIMLVWHEYTTFITTISWSLLQSIDEDILLVYLEYTSGITTGAKESNLD